MYKTFKSSLFKPALIFPHIKDRMRKAWLFFFLMWFLTIIPVVIMLSMNIGMLSPDQKVFQRLYREGLADNYYIVDSELQYDANDVTKVGLRTDNYIVTFSNYNIENQTFDSPFVFRLQKDGIEFKIISVQSSFYTYEELGIINLDLSNTNSADVLLQALNHIVKDNIITHHLTVFIILAGGNLISMLFIVLLLSVFVFKPIPFSLKFKLNMFLLAPLALLQFFGTLYGLSQELFIVGVIWMSFNSLRLFRNIDLIRK